MQLQVNDLYGGVVGTVLASVMLAAVPADQTPMYAAAWIVVGVAIAAVTRSYGQHVSTHQAGSRSGFWVDLGRSMLTGIPMVIACVPTLIVLLLAHFAGWSDDVFHPDGSVTPGYTTVALGLNAAILFGWGVVAARVGGYSRWGACGVGIANTTLGLVVVVLNVILN
ncbi:hypothetical protein ACFVAV_30675 [Nocardia sp. NPDC057663]|uniref:hypothetical protein n=1 Tax=Nocardia sp. NPDC057663 TaxID=3346201 RepID=UPI00366EFD44